MSDEDTLTQSEIVTIRAKMDEPSDEKRLAKVEAQTRVLAEAVLAMAHPAVSVTSSVQAVADEMLTRDGVPGTRTAEPSLPRWNECPVCGSLLTDPAHRSPDGHGYKFMKCTKCLHRWTRAED
jgi:formate dehydrogenase maturation protein FdhE